MSLVIPEARRTYEFARVMWPEEWLMLMECSVEALSRS